MRGLVVGGDERETQARLEKHRAELTGYCYRMPGSYAEAEDAVQETVFRAWRNAANGTPAFGQYRPDPDGFGCTPWAHQVVEFSGDRISGITAFGDTDRLFPLFGLPARVGPARRPEDIA